LLQNLAFSSFLFPHLGQYTIAPTSNMDSGSTIYELLMNSGFREESFSKIVNFEMNKFKFEIPLKMVYGRSNGSRRVDGPRGGRCQ
jgi:hypothetical protein